MFLHKYFRNSLLSVYVFSHTENSFDLKGENQSYQELVYIYSSSTLARIEKSDSKATWDLHA